MNTHSNLNPITCRFAPTPSGGLHLGSLMIALYGFVIAKRSGGQWWLRIDDGDPPRIKAGAELLIQQQLSFMGLPWDGIFRQSERKLHYQKALEKLNQLGLVYPCVCRRGEHVRDQEGHCPCWKKRSDSLPTEALRYTLYPSTQIQVNNQVTDLLAYEGDFLIRRKDGLIAYQLMSAIDDALNNKFGINGVVRGSDLMISSARQIHIQTQCGLKTPQYIHLPLLLDRDGRKLSKSTQAMPIDSKNAGHALTFVLKLLGQNPPFTPPYPEAPKIIEWALTYWQDMPIPKEKISVLTTEI